MKKVAFGIFFGVLFLVLGSTNIYAEMCICRDKMGEVMYDEGVPMMEGMRHRGMGIAGARHHIWQQLKDLGLDDKQEEAIKALGSRVAKETVKKTADLKIAGLELRDILQKDPVDMKAVEAKLRQIEALRTDIRLARIGAFEDIKAKLSPDQSKKLKKALEKHGLCGCRDRGVNPERREKKGMRPPV